MSLGLDRVELAHGLVRHQRFKPKPNGFETGVCFIRLIFSPKGGLTTAGKCNGLNIDQGGLLSVKASSYGLEKHSLQFPALIETLKQTIQQSTNVDLDGEVHLHTFPKVLGYAFNPVSFWHFHDTEGRCKVILCEVNNTFGERHFYLLQNPGTEVLNRGALLQSTKEFHVSPFFPVSGRYEFRFMQHQHKSVARINYFDQNELKLTTSVSGEFMTPTSKRWAQALTRYGWFTLMVIVKIHWQALKLLAKGAKFHTKPEPPTRSISQTRVKSET
ncbi:MAG TPA: DUF1365 domain-containing protein [Limnobacter sp.]|uniref:DUF1365 domain-containing protein n=1 Tax=Limnobacter sp. TaxID=2003368 RepID=UPI002E38163D|nr:DUF1365 domain-containing protein [Limnobacter sp.]HEX5486194.1 DUF1365 domain-containing protein [Limnobacter sp.]